MRNNLIKNLVQSGLTGFKILDSYCITNCSPTAGITERLEALKRITERDGIHLTSAGYPNLAERAINCLKTIMNAPKKS
jgi:hypothetical protein